MTEWDNKIVGYGNEDPEQLLANPKNHRIHPRFQQDALEQMLDKVGWVKNIVVNRATGHVVDGHLRVMLAMRRHEDFVPVSYVELTEREEEVALATIDAIAELAVVDEDALQDLASGLNSSLDGTIREMMEGMVELEDLHAQIDTDPLPGAQDSILPASDGPSDPQPSPNGSEPSDARMLDVTCPHCAAEWPVDLDQLERDDQ